MKHLARDNNYFLLTSDLLVYMALCLKKLKETSLEADISATAIIIASIFIKSKDAALYLLKI